MEIKGYTLVNDEKVGRALNGVEIDGNLKGGVGNGAYFEDNEWKRDGSKLSEKEAESLETALLAEYDKLGGLIKKGDDKVKMGSFYDFKAKKPRALPKVTFVYRVNGKHVEVPDGVELPGAVKAARLLEKEASQDESVDESEHTDTPKSKKSKK